MAKKSSRKLVYTLSSQSSLQGHSLGVNSLAIDPTPPAPDSNLSSVPLHNPAISNTHSINGLQDPSDDSSISGVLYSAGRDGSIIAWNLCDMNLSSPQYISSSSASSSDPLSNTTNNTSLLLPTPPSQQQQPQQQYYVHERQFSVGSNMSIPRQISSYNNYPRSINSLTSDNTHSKSHFLGPSLAAFLNSVTPNDAPTIPPLPSKSHHGKTTFGICGQIHTNWVNDILLINNNKSGMFIVFLFLFLFI